MQASIGVWDIGSVLCEPSTNSYIKQMVVVKSKREGEQS